MIRKGDESDCPFCTALFLVTQEDIRKAQIASRGPRPVRGQGAREMGSSDLNGKAWGHKPGKGVAGFGPGKRGK
ncbi:MAG TPA: hypothetical protein VM285_04765 [Polyangia bacterium]|nr:hypothetical protein [Polyangia bacterium]